MRAGHPRKSTNEQLREALQTNVRQHIPDWSEAYHSEARRLKNLYGAGGDHDYVREKIVSAREGHDHVGRGGERQHDEHTASHTSGSASIVSGRSRGAADPHDLFTQASSASSSHLAATAASHDASHFYSVPAALSADRGIYSSAPAALSADDDNAVHMTRRAGRPWYPASKDLGATSSMAVQTRYDSTAESSAMRR